MKSIFIYPNMSKNDITECVVKVCKKLKNCTIFIDENCKIEGFTNASLKDFKGDFIITLGGDGTMLTALSACPNIPIIGINLGHLGFLTELELNELDYLDNIFKNNFKIDKRMLLKATIIRDSNIILDEIALNDVIVKTEDSFRIMHLELFSDGELVLDIGGDGVIVSSPTGSTAYSLAAGGPIIEPTAENLCVTPICSHKLTGKSFVFEKNRVITIKTFQRNDNSAYIAIDGSKNFHLKPHDTIEIKKSDIYASFIRVKGKNFYSILNEKIGG